MRRLQALPGTTVVLLETPGDLCVVLEGGSLAEIEIRQRDLQGLDGVLAAWPVYTHLEDLEAPDPDEEQRSAKHRGTRHDHSSTEPA